MEQENGKTIQLQDTGGLGLSRFLSKAARNTAGHLSIVSIVGPARAGKSLLLSVSSGTWSQLRNRQLPHDMVMTRGSNHIS